MFRKIKKAYLTTEKTVGGFAGIFKRFRIFHSSIFQVYFLGIITTLIIELLSKKSLVALTKWVFCHPLIFLTNVCIVSLFYSFAVAFRRKYFLYSIAAFIWLFIGVTNSIVTANRVTPFTAGDVKTLSSVFTVISKYITAWKFGLIVAGIVIILALIVNGYFRFPRIGGKFRYVKNGMLAVILMAVNFLLINLSMRFGIMSVNFVNLRNAYQDYGLAYCFSNSVVNTGINKPKGYSKKKVDDILSNIATAPDAGAADDDETGKDTFENDKPNVIFVQLESLFDVNRLEGVEFKEDPLPTLTELKKKYSSGLLRVPSISAGTANTEFEILTGMNMDDFGPGEYPFKTVLSKDLTTESIANNLKEYGYSTHGIHNNTAGFYSRKIVYPNLGIDTFTSIEYMTNVKLNALGWAKDDVLTKYINQALDSTENQDFVFTVSVQGHGAYPDEDVLEDDSLLVSLDGLSGEVGEYNFAYYLEQIHEMDQFVADLIATLEKRNEKTVLVLYGDHLPGFDFTEEDLSIGTLYDTEYVIWSNFDLGEKQDKDMEAYELNAYVMDMLGYDAGLITKLHQNRDKYDTVSYLEALKTLEYDMLYGDMNCWNGENPYVSHPVKYGYEEITIDSIALVPEEGEKNYYYLFISGKNFTDYSRVFLNENDKLSTTYMNDHLLYVPGVELEPGDEIYVSQSSSSITTLTATTPYVVTEEDLSRKFNITITPVEE